MDLSPGGVVTTVPMSADEAKQMALDIVKREGGKYLSKASGTSMCQCSHVCVTNALKCASTMVVSMLRRTEVSGNQES